MTNMIPAGGEYGTALQAASHQGNPEVVTLLLQKGAEPNVQGGIMHSRGCMTHITLAGGKYGTALQAAAAMRRAKYNFDGTAPPAALVAGYVEIVTLLLGNGADPNVQGVIF
jgi:ankyrin repeat protein